MQENCQGKWKSQHDDDDDDDAKSGSACETHQQAGQEEGQGEQGGISKLKLFVCSEKRK